MGDTGEYWRDVKEHYRTHQNKYEQSIKTILDQLKNRPDCVVIGDHWRIQGEWDFWWTGTAYNIKTKENSTVKMLYKRLQDNPTHHD